MNLKNLQILPHKNLILSSVVALSIFAVGFLLTHKKEAELRPSALATQHPSTVQTEVYIDTDNDGLPDWKEKLLGSDLNNPDTDGDGTNDGDEMRLGRNPLMRNTAGKGILPNDKLTTLGDRRFASSSANMSNAKKEFFAKYLAEGSKNIKETTFRDLIKKVDAKAFAPQEQIINLKISANNSTEGVKTYLNAFGTVFKPYLVNSIGRSEDAILTDAVTKKDPSSMADVQILAGLYKNFASDLLDLRVPSTLAKAHLLIVNGYEGMAQGLVRLGNIQKDPINGTAGYEAYMKYRLDVAKGYAMIVVDVAHQHIVLTADEPGYPFYWNTAATKVSARVDPSSTTGQPKQ